MTPHRRKQDPPRHRSTSSRRRSRRPRRHQKWSRRSPNGGVGRAKRRCQPRYRRKRPLRRQPNRHPAPLSNQRPYQSAVSAPAVSRNGIEPAVVPKTGVEILSVEDRDGERYYRMRDLRSGRVADNVTRKSARRLWRQAILERETGLPEPAAIKWDGPFGYWGSSDRDGVRRHNLAYRDDGTIRYFYAVSDDGINGAWQTLIATEGA